MRGLEQGNAQMQAVLGQRVGRYELLAPLGSGGVGTVYRARIEGSSEEVAVKLLHPWVQENTTGLEEFFRVQQKLRELQHPRILPVLETGHQDRQAWTVMPLIRGGSLRSWLEEDLPIEVVLRIGVQIAEALHAAHEAGVLHGDLKPSNVLLNDAGDVLVADFGTALLAKSTYDNQAVQTTPLPSYMSPQEIRQEPPDPRDDVYALGILLYELLTGSVPYWGYTPVTVLVKQEQRNAPPISRVNPRVPRQVEQAVHRAFAFEREERYPSAAAFADALRALLSGPVSPAFSPEEQAWVRGVGGEDLGEEAVRVLCPVCGYGNPTDRHYCLQCRSRLEQADVVSAEMATERLVERKRYVIQQRVLRSVVSAAIVVGALFGIYLHSRAEAPYPLPAPASAISSASAPGEWAMFGNDPGRMNATAASGPQAGRVVWSTPTGPDPFLASPVVAEGVIYAPTGDRRILALEASTGRVLWESPTTGPVDSTPAIAGDLLYVGLRDSRLIALSKRDGQLVWQFKAGGPITGSPTVRDGVVYIGAGDGVLYALDALQGTLRWQYEIDSWVHSSPAVSEQFVAVGGRDGFVYTFETQRAERRLDFTPLSWPLFQPEEHPRGVLRLKYDLRRWPVDATPAIVGATVYIGADDGHIRALDATVSIPQWRQVVRELQGHLFALGIAGPPGRQPGLIWDFAGRGRFTGGVAVTKEAVFAGSSDGYLYAINRETGEPFWGWTEQQAPARRGRQQAQGTVRVPVAFRADGPILGSPVVAGTTLYAVSQNGTVYALDTLTGQQKWSLSLPTKVTTSPALGGGLLFVTGVDGAVYAIE